MAAQLTASRAPRRVTSLKWIAWATSSLPVPVSPVTSTLHGDDATRATRSKTSDHPRASTEQVVIGVFLPQPAPQIGHLVDQPRSSSAWLTTISSRIVSIGLRIRS